MTAGEKRMYVGPTISAKRNLSAKAKPTAKVASR
jgi:hypothetical protein